MKARQFTSFVLLVMFFCSSLYAQVRVGDKAPPVIVQEWLKGEPVTEFENGKLYVIEFSGTWCPPCTKAIPHLSYLSKKYASKVKTISVYIGENNRNDTIDLAYLSNVQYFINAVGNKMDFAVAVDVPKQTTMKSWGPNGIPKAFVINEAGYIVWKGHPLDLEPILERVIDGTFNSKSAMLEQQKFDACLKSAMSNKNSKTALMSLDSLIKVYPEKTWLYANKFIYLTELSSGDPYELLERMLNQNLKHFAWSHFISGAFKRIEEGKRNYEMELRAINRAIEEAETIFLQASSFLMKAETYLTMGESLQALEFCHKAVECSKSPGGNLTTTQWYEGELILYKYKAIASQDFHYAGKWLKSKIDSLANERIGLYYSNKLIDIVTRPPQSNYDLAVEFIDKVYNNDSVNNGFYLGEKAIIYAAMGNFSKAIEFCRQAIKEYEKYGVKSKVQEFQVLMSDYKRQKKLKFYKYN